MAERPSGRDESEAERLDRNLGELLQELRVALPGVQVLFAFLLAVPFQQNFTKITAFQETGLLRHPAADRGLGGAADLAVGLPPDDLPRCSRRTDLVLLANQLAIAGWGSWRWR